MPSGLFLFCAFLFSTSIYENAKQIIYIFIYCLCFSAIVFNSSYSIMTKCSFSIFNKMQVVYGFLIEYEASTKITVTWAAF